MMPTTEDDSTVTARRSCGHTEQVKLSDYTTDLGALTILQALAEFQCDACDKPRQLLEQRYVNAFDRDGAGVS